MVAIFFGNTFADYRIIARPWSRRKFQIQSRIVDLVNLYFLYFLQLLYAALHLHRLSSLVAKALNESFSLLYLLLLILIRPHLLLYTLLMQNDILRIINLIVVDLATRNLQRAVCHIVNECTVVRHENHNVSLLLQERFKPLNRLNVEVVGRLIEQQHIRTHQQQFCQFYTHAPSATEFRCVSVKIRADKSQTKQRLFKFRLPVLALLHLNQVAQIRDAVNQFGIRFRLIIRPFGKLCVHTGKRSLHLVQFSEHSAHLLHNRTFVSQNHLLREIADCNVFLRGDDTACRFLESGYYLQHR